MSLCPVEIKEPPAVQIFSFPLCCECCITQNQITLTLLLTSWKNPVLMSMFTIQTSFMTSSCFMIDRLRGASGPLTSLRAFPSTDLQFQLTQLSSPLFVARDRCLRGLNTHVGAYVDKSFWSPQLTHFLSLLLQVFNYYMGKSWLQSMAVPKNITVPAPILIFGAKFLRL